MSKILHADYSANFAMDDRCEKMRMKKTKNKLENVIFPLNLGGGNMPM